MSIEDFLEPSGKYFFDEQRKKYPDFNAMCNISEFLFHIGKERIAPDSKEGKHLQIELDDCVKIFCAEYEQFGIKPKMTLTWELK